MQYLLLIYSSENSDGAVTDEERQAIFKRYIDFTEEVKQKGAFIAGDALQGVNTATSVRVREGKVMTTDGPFAETKEQLGGYYLLDCKDLDEALAYAAKIPASEHGTIEVRPIQHY